MAATGADRGDIIAAVLRLPPSLPLLLTVVLTVDSGCSKRAQPASAPVVQAPLPAIELPAAIPAEAVGVVVVRTSESLFAAVANLELLGTPAPADIEAMRSDLDQLLRTRLGMTLTTADRATAFVTAKGEVGVVVEGVKGQLRGPPSGEVEGLALYAIDGATVADLGLALIIGDRGAVQLAVEAAKGKRPALRDGEGPLVQALVEGSEGVTMSAAVDLSGLPPSMLGELAGLGVEQAMMSYGAGGIRVAAYGRPEGLAVLRDQVDRTLDQLSATAEQEYQRVQRGDDVWAGIAATMAYHQGIQVRSRLALSLEGRRLGMSVPVRFDDPMVLAAFAGMAAAIAIPAFTKYQRRSKTSEARVRVAQLFDATAAFVFDEDRLTVEGGDAAIRCPSDGRAIGSAGTTPPLELDCSAGPSGMCVPVEGTPRGPGEYPIALWTDNPVWHEMKFVLTQPHAFHYDFRWNNGAAGPGTCQFTVQAFGDLDDDGLFSTYERAGAADRLGLNAAAGLYIDQEIE